MSPVVLYVYLFVIIRVYGTLIGQLYNGLSNSRFVGQGTVLNGYYSDIACCAYCEGQEDNCPALNHNKDHGLCEILQLTTVRPHPTTNSSWNSYFKRLSDFDYKSEATTEQSSTSYDGYALYAVDNQYILDFHTTRLCTHTAGSTSNWLLVDFKRNYPIRGLTLWNRNDGYHERLRDITITISANRTDVDAVANRCATYNGPAENGSPVEITCSSVMKGRFLMIKMNTTFNNVLTVCEIDLI